MADHRHIPQKRPVDLAFHVLLALDRIVEIFQQKGQPHPGKESDDHREHHVLAFVGAHRHKIRFGPVLHADIVGLKSRQIRGGDHRFLAGQVFVAFLLDAPGDLLELLPGPQDFGVLVFVDLGQFIQLGLELDVFILVQVEDLALADIGEIAFDKVLGDAVGDLGGQHRVLVFHAEAQQPGAADLLNRDRLAEFVHRVGVHRILGARVQRHAGERDDQVAQLIGPGELIGRLRHRIKTGIGTEVKIAEDRFQQAAAGDDLLLALEVFLVIGIAAASQPHGIFRDGHDIARFLVDEQGHRRPVNGRGQYGLDGHGGHDDQKYGHHLPFVAPDDAPVVA